jgi:hypothetical protein
MLALVATAAALPWLQGFDATAVTDRTTTDVADELADWEPSEACPADAYGGLELDADLVPAAGDERVIATFSRGLAVLDRDGHAIASAPGLPCEGSADELLALAAGDAWIGTPVLALAATTGGHRESSTWLTLYRVAGADLVPIFSGEVERHAGHTTRTGTVMLFPGGLVYRAPSGEAQIWRYDPEHGRYVNGRTLAPSA